MALFRITAFSILVLAGAAAALAAESVSSAITRAAVIRELSREDANKALPVKLSGVVTYMGWQNFTLHDGDSSVFADFHFSGVKGLWKWDPPDEKDLQPGSEVEIEGVTDPGGFSPMVLVTKFRKIGTREMPLPLRPSVGELLSSSMDSQWLEVEGVVWKCNPEPTPSGPASLSVVFEGQHCVVVLRNPSHYLREQLVDAKVRVRGVLLNIVNLRSEVAGLKIHSNGDQDIDIVVPPPDPFQAPRVALNRLIPFSPHAESDHRRVSSGVVTFVIPGRFLYVTDSETSVKVETAVPGIVPGDRVEVSGFIDNSRGPAYFSETSVRVIGKGKVPVPERADNSRILNPEVRSHAEMITNPGYPDCNGKLLRLSGILRRMLPRDKLGRLTLVIESENNLVQVYLPVSGAGDVSDTARWVEGSVVELTGVAELEIERLDELPFFSITGFHVWLSSQRDLRLVSTPPWWTPLRLWILLSGVLLVLGLALVWLVVMRRQVASRGRQLATEIAAREVASLGFDAVLRERERLANDLHDTLEQALTGLALQLKITECSRTADPELSARHLKLAQQFLERSRQEVHRTVWDLRAHGLAGRDFLDILLERANAMVAGSSVGVAVEREGATFPLPDLVAGNLLLLAQEAVTNALKHAAPRRIEICLRFVVGGVELVVKDDGYGFDQDTAPGENTGHFGLQGMRERSKRLGGSIEVMSAVGRGTSITARAPVNYSPTY